MHRVQRNAELEALHVTGVGFVFNDFTSGPAGAHYNVLHAAGCRWVGRMLDRAEPQSRPSVRKMFFDTIGEAQSWLVPNRGPEGRGWNVARRAGPIAQPLATACGCEPTTLASRSPLSDRMGSGLDCRGYRAANSSHTPSRACTCRSRPAGPCPGQLPAISGRLHADDLRAAGARWHQGLLHMPRLPSRSSSSISSRCSAIGIAPVHDLTGGGRP